jgi:hypothetical protein
METRATTWSNDGKASTTTGKACAATCGKNDESVKAPEPEKEKKASSLYVFLDLILENRNRYICGWTGGWRNGKKSRRGGTFPVVTGVRVTDDEGIDHFVTCKELKNIFQLPKLCKLIGLENSSSFGKFVCRQQIAALIHDAWGPINYPPQDPPDKPTKTVQKRFSRPPSSSEVSLNQIQFTY